MKLLLIRHGESRGNASHRMQGRLDEPLTERGREQSCRLAERLQGWSIKHTEPISAVYSSTLARAYQTASILVQCWGVPLVLDKRLCERDIGALQGLTWPEVETRYPQVAQTMRQKWTAHTLPGGESVFQLTDRMWQAITGIVDRSRNGNGGRCVAIVSHGAAINAYFNRLMGRGDGKPFLFSLGNTSLSIVEFQNGRPRILLANDLCHLE